MKYIWNMKDKGNLDRKIVCVCVCVCVRERERERERKITKMCNGQRHVSGTRNRIYRSTEAVRKTRTQRRPG